MLLLQAWVRGDGIIVSGCHPTTATTLGEFPRRGAGCSSPVGRFMGLICGGSTFPGCPLPKGRSGELVNSVVEDIRKLGPIRLPKRLTLQLGDLAGETSSISLPPPGGGRSKVARARRAGHGTSAGSCGAGGRAGQPNDGTTENQSTQPARRRTSRW